MNREEFLSSFENVCELFEEIGSTSSRLEKESLLSNYHDSEFLKDILLYTYNPYYIYGIDKKTVESYNKSRFKCSSTPETIYELLDYLKENNTGRDFDKDEFYFLLDNVDSDFLASWIKKIVLKDLKVGINIETINKIFPKLIPTFKVALCKTYESPADLRYGEYIVQPKLDGVRIIAICTGGSAELYTRNGMKVEGYDDVIKELSMDCWKDLVLDGEIMTGNFDGTMEGLFALKSNKKAVYHVFDLMSLSEFNSKRCEISYAQRFEHYNSIITSNNFQFIDNVSGIIYENSEIVSDVSVLDKQARSLGYEGLILKGYNSPYEFKRSYSWVKYKSWQSEDFEVIGMEEGTGKYADSLGAIVVNANGVAVKVGSGFSDEQREHLWSNQDDYINSAIAEVRFQEKTKDGSLRFPTFIKFRNDI